MPEADDIGKCAFVVDWDSEEVCNQPGIAEVLVRNKFGLFAVPLCLGHKGEHVRFYRARNQSAASSDTRRRITQGSRV